MLIGVLVPAAMAAGPEGLFFREGTRDIPAAQPITQEHVANPELLLKLYGPGAAKVKKSFHETAKNDPHYIWSGECPDRWAVAFEKKGATADLSGEEARIRLRVKNSDRTLYVALKTNEGWLVSDQGIGPSENWQTSVIKIKELSWSSLDIASVQKGQQVGKPSLKSVTEIGFTDLDKGGGGKASSRVDWLEVWEKSPPQAPYAVQAADGLQFYDGEQPVFFYHTRPNSYKGGYTRSNYIHPLMGLDGEVLTEDFPDDHLHQRGIFWTWHQVLVDGKSLGDGWDCADIIWDVHTARIIEGPAGSATIEAKVHWKSPRWQNGAKPFMEETVTLRLHPLVDGVRAIDFVIVLTALTDGLKLGGSDNERGYGGFSVRMILPRDLAMSGPGGAVTAQGNAVDAGGWLNFNASFGKGKSDIAVFVHPSSPGYPQKWILRRASSMQNPVYPGRHPVSISREKPITLKYRILVHKNADLASLFAEYSKQ